MASIAAALLGMALITVLNGIEKKKNRSN
jgi:hypothetical protein